MDKRNRWPLAVATGLALAWAGQGCATEYLVSYSGAQFGNSAIGSAYIDIADSALMPPAGSANHLLPNADFQIEYITISQAGSGNGVFLGGDYASYTFKASSALTPDTQLIGQSLSNGGTFGSFGSGYSLGTNGDFGIFANHSISATAPTAQQRFVIGTNGGSGDLLAITSIAPYTAPVLPRYEVEWSGAAFGNGATASAIIDIAPGLLSTIGGNSSNHILPSDSFRIESVTVSGAAAGNGMFGGGDFASYNFRTADALDPTKDLVGQHFADGFTFGDPNANVGGSDFNLVGLYGTGAPSLGARYVLAAGGIGGDQMQLESIRPLFSSVPEPASWAMMLAGFALTGGILRRRRYATA
jgi:hypothetical protein